MVPMPPLALKLTANRGSTGVTLFDLDETTPSPYLFSAAAVNEYVVPSVSPPMWHLVVAQL